MAAIGHALADDIRWSWPGAELWHDNAIHDGHVFWIQAAGRDHLLEVSEPAKWRAMMCDDAAGLMDALRAQRWIDFLLEHGCGFLSLSDGEYILRTCP